jgi:hypothetical protein
MQFHRVGPDHVCLLDFQRDKYWTNAEGKFAINIGIYFPAVEAIRGRPPIEGIPPDGCWTVTTRLALLATGKDRWWTLTPKGNLGRLAGELQEGWRDFGRPWIEKNKVLANARDWQLENYAEWPAVLSTVVLGQRDVARRILRDFWFRGRNRDPDVVKQSQALGLVDHTEAERLTWALMQDATTLRRILDETFGTEGETLPRN